MPKFKNVTKRGTHLNRGIYSYIEVEKDVYIDNVNEVNHDQFDQFADNENVNEDLNEKVNEDLNEDVLWNNGRRLVELDVLAQELSKCKNENCFENWA